MKKTLCIYAALLASMVVSMAQTVVSSGYPELDEWAQECIDNHLYALGFPGNYNGKLDGFYKWYTLSG